MTTPPLLLPAPRSLKFTGDNCQLIGNNLIHLQHDRPQELLFSASRLKEALNAYFGLDYDIYAGHLASLKNPGISLQVNRTGDIQPQGYRIRITPFAIIVEATDAAGIFYACSTLLQLFLEYSAHFQASNEAAITVLPCMDIEDWPDFPNRGVMLDISRDKVPTMQTMLDLVDLLASWKINQLQLYTEHTFAYLAHHAVWAKASPFTGEEILQLDAYCRERFIELVPNQNSFGHMEHWLRLPEYNSLAEAPEGFDFPWGHQVGPFSLCPLDPGSLELLSGLYDELLPHFSSRQFNVGCDETFDLGQGRSKAECERSGTGRVYLDFLLKIYKEVARRGHRMQFWGDIIMGHPELVAELPKDSIALEWGYETDHPFDEHGAKFSQAGLAFYVCPGTSSWNSIAGRTDNCLGNLANAAQNGLKHGAEGYLITDWGDNGHWQVLPVSYLGFLAGAAYAWCYQANINLDIANALSHFAFMDPSGNMGRLCYQLGNIYHRAGFEPPNASALFDVLQKPEHEWKDYWGKDAAIATFRHVLKAIDELTTQYIPNTSTRNDKNLLKRELQQTIALLQHACKRGLYFYQSGEYSKQDLLHEMDFIVEEYRQIWLERNRPGGLEDSLAHFARTRTDYI